MELNDDLLAEYLKNLLESNLSRSLEQLQMLAAIQQLTQTQADLQQMLVNLTEQLLARGIIYRPDLRGHEHLS